MRARERLVAVATAAVLIALITACGSDDKDSTPALPTSAASAASSAIDHAQQATPSAEYSFLLSGGKKAAGPESITAKTEDTIVILVTSDFADELHVHGYDKEAELEPGKPARLELHGAAPGVYEVELHNSGLKLASIEVTS